MTKNEENFPKGILHFKVLEILGRGGNGTVYRAENTKTGQILALKTLNLPTDSTLNRFKKEFFALKKMDHPHIVKVFNAFFDHSPPFFSMEWIKGKTLGRIISDMKKNPLIFTYKDREDFAIEVCKQLCKVLTYIHGFDEIHRDLKPENIFITQGGGNLLKGFSIKILDFGLLKQLNSQQANKNTQHGMVVGTVQFLSPEQAKGGHLDARSDLFSVGVILYNILSLELPFHAKDLVAYLFQIVFEEPIPIIERVDDISPKMESIIKNLLQKTPSNRYPSAQALARALDFSATSDGLSDIKAEDFVQSDSFEGFGDPLLPPCMVARDKEIEKMLSLAHRLTGQTPSILLLKAEDGLGKTFILNEWQSKLRFDSKTIFTHTFTSQTSPTQDPIGMLMDNLIREMKPAEVQEMFKDLYPFLSGVSRYLGRYFDMRSVGSLEHLSSGRKLQLIASNFIKLIHKLSEKGPVIMILEDAHLAPERFFGWLTIFLEQINAPRFLMILSFVPDMPHPALQNLIARLDSRSLSLTIHLKPITQQETKKLLQSMIPVNKTIPFSSELDLFIAQNSGGNPHLAIELFTRLYEEKGVKLQKGQLVLSHDNPVQLPQSIHQALLLKIQKLPPVAMEFVESASILGHEFELPWLRGILEWEDETFFSVFMELVRAGVFREEDEPIHKVFFQNADLRKQVYSSISDANKTRLHRLAAKSIEKIYNHSRDEMENLSPDRLSLFLEHLSMHFSRSRSFVQATKYAYFSGNLALEQKNTPKAISLYKECLTMMSFSDNKHTLNLVNLKLGEVFLADHKYDEAISYFESALHSKKKSKIEELRIFKGLTQAYRRLGEFDMAMNVSSKLVQLSLSCSPKVSADSLVERGLLFWEAKGNGLEFQAHIKEAEKKSNSFQNLDYLKTYSSLFSNDLKIAVHQIKTGKEKDISPTPFLIALAWLNYMSGQFKKGFSYLDSLKKGEKDFPVDPRSMVFKSLMTYLLKRKIAPDHSADEYLHMASRYLERFALESYSVYIDLFRLEDLLLNGYSELACQIIEKYRNGSKQLPIAFTERKLLIFFALHAIWRQVEVPPRPWLDEFNEFEPQNYHSLILGFHHSLALNANALLPLSGNVQNAVTCMSRCLQQLKKFNLKYFQAIVMMNQMELFTKLEEPAMIDSLKDEYNSLKPFLRGHSLSN